MPRTISQWTLLALQVSVTECGSPNTSQPCPQPKPPRLLSFASLSPASLSYVIQPVWSYTLLVVFGFWSPCLCASPGSPPIPSLDPLSSIRLLLFPFLFLLMVLSILLAVPSLDSSRWLCFPSYLHGKPSQPHLRVVKSSFSFSRLLGLVVKRFYH